MRHSAFDMLHTIGQAKPGTRLLVVEPFTARWNEQVSLPQGTVIKVTTPGGDKVFGIADLGGRLQRVCIEAEQFHCVERAPGDPPR